MSLPNRAKRSAPLAFLALCCAACDKDASSDDSAAIPTDTGLGDCSEASDNASQVVCAAEAFLATLDEDQQDTVLYAWDDAEAKTLWSNLPPKRVPRAGIQFSELSDESLAAAYTVARAALSDQGYEDFVGIIAADAYLYENGGGSDYGAGNYSIAFIGTPSATGDWMLMLGGHHMAFNLTWQSGQGAPTPNHLAAEPKSAFTLGGERYAPAESEGAAFEALFAGLSATELSEAYLDGQVFADVLLGPDEYGTGSGSVDFPTGADRGGLAVSSLDATQQALVAAVIEEWVGDFDASIADDLRSTYTSEAAWADTLIGWAGDESAGPDVDEEGTYFRIDGPRVWIELACQGGVVIRGETHFHTIYRDRENDYGGSI